MFDCSHVTLVQMNLEQSGPIELDSNALANNLSGEDQILQHGFVHGCQCAAPGSLLLALCARLASGFRQDPALQPNVGVLSVTNCLRFTMI